MTDKEIIQALECCLPIYVKDCANCPYFEQSTPECKGEMLKDALALINRQQAEVERLTERVHFLCGKSGALQVEIQKYQTDVEQWKQEANRYQSLWCEDVQIARAEAIKEFAERLKKEIYTNIKNNTMTKSQYIAENYKCLSCDFIATSRGKNEGLKTAFKLVNNLVKEMVGEQDGT